MIKINIKIKRDKYLRMNGVFYNAKLEHWKTNSTKQKPGTLESFAAFDAALAAPAVAVIN
jgi:hypothetical protein